MTAQVLNIHWVSERNQCIANWLIDLFEIRQGYGLAHYLKVPICSDNHTAVALWVEKCSAASPKQFYTLGELKQGFAKLLPMEKYWR